MIVGNWMLVAGDNPDVVNPQNDENDGSSHTPAHGYLTRISAIDGTNITLQDGLPWTTTVNRFAAVYNYSSGALENFVENAGIEDIGIDANGGITGVGFVYAANCWMTNCEIFDAQTRNVFLSVAAHNTVHGCLVRDTRGNGSGGGYGILLEGKSTQNLIENNRFNMCATALLVDDGAMGNVIAYNYIHDFKFFQANWQVVQLSHHRAHPMFTLWEGNYAPNFVADNIHGSASHPTLFRNRIHGHQDEVRTNSLWCVAMNRNALYLNSVGNVVGTSGFTNTYMQDNDTGIAYSTASSYTLGFANFHYSTEGHDPDPKSTAHIHGDWDAATSSVRWDAGSSDRNIPDSLYLTSEPTWFGDRPWPPFDPTEPTEALATNIPAGYRYINGADPPSTEGSVPSAPIELARFLANADEGIITSPFLINADQTISQSVQTLDPLLGGRAVYNFTVPRAGHYILSASVNCPDGGSNSFFVNVDAEPTVSHIWNVPVTVGVENRSLHWMASNSPPLPQPKVWTLSAGNHSLILRGREANSKVLRFVFSRSPMAIP